MSFALFAWFAQAALLAGMAKTATGKACNECKTLGQLGLVQRSPKSGPRAKSGPQAFLGMFSIWQFRVNKFMQGVIT